jgi:hypothetical protein
MIIRTKYLALLAISLMVSGTMAQAAYIPLLNNESTHQSILADDFESYDLHSAPNNCGPEKAIWGQPFGVSAEYGNSVGIWQSTYGGLTGGEGNKCLLVDRGAGGCGITGYGDADRSNVGETIKASMLFYNFNVETSVYLQQGDTTLLQLGIFGSNGGTGPGIVKVLNPDQATWSDTGFRFANEESAVWSKLEVTYVNGNLANKFAISVDGGDPFTATGYAAGNLNAIMFKSDANHSTGLFDAVGAVPEPSSLAVLVSGILGLLAYAWRKRR